jgi:hypothetical protein
MPRGGTRKRKAKTSADDKSSSPSTKKTKTSSSSTIMFGKSKAKSKSAITTTNQAASMFDRIADPDDPTIATMEGISTLCEDLELDIEDIRILVLLWKMKAVEKPAQISKEEWMTACHRMNISQLQEFQSLLPTLDIGFMEEDDFKDFYKYCFQFNRQGTHRTLNKDLVVDLLQLVLKGRIPQDRLDTFCTFLKKSESYSRITLDQWTSFLDFCNDVEDLSQYDQDTSAWPVLIDEYVEYMEQQDKMDM